MRERRQVVRAWRLGQPTQESAEARNTSALDLARDALALGGQRDEPAAAVRIGRPLGDVARGHHPGAQPSAVALVDAQLTTEILLGELAATEEHHQRVRVRNRARHATGGRVTGQRAEAPEQTLYEPSQLVDLTASIARWHETSLSDTRCVRSQMIP